LDSDRRRKRGDGARAGQRGLDDTTRRTRRQDLRLMDAWRDLGCGEPRLGDDGRTVTLAGWAARRRDHGGLIFIDLRDESGITQLVLNPEHAPQATEVAHGVRNEFVLQARGTVVRRSTETVNPKMATGDVEVQVEELKIL